MPLQHAYSITNRLAGLAVGSFVWSPATTTNRNLLNDGAMDRRFAVASTATTINVTIDLGVAIQCDLAAVLNSNIGSASGATLEVRASSDNFVADNVLVKAATTLQTTTNARPYRGKDHALAFTAATKRHWRLTWTWNGSYALQVGELWLGSATALSRVITYGHGESAPFKVVKNESDTGNVRAHFLAGPVRRKRLPFADLTKTQLDELLAMVHQTYGGGLPFLFLPTYESTAIAAIADAQDCIFGRVVEDDLPWSEPDFDLFEPEAVVIQSEGREVGA